MTSCRLAYLSAAVLLALATAGATPALAQGAYMSPPAPNASNSMPQAVNSVPPGARTLPPGSTGSQRTGTVNTFRTEAAPVQALATPATRTVAR